MSSTGIFQPMSNATLTNVLLLPLSVGGGVLALLLCVGCVYVWRHGIFSGSSVVVTIDSHDDVAVDVQSEHDISSCLEEFSETTKSQLIAMFSELNPSTGVYFRAVFPLKENIGLARPLVHLRHYEKVISMAEPDVTNLGTRENALVSTDYYQSLSVKDRKQCLQAFQTLATLVKRHAKDRIVLPTKQSSHVHSTPE